MDKSDFLKIIGLAQAGKPQAFNRFYNQFQPICKNKLLSYVSTATEAEDAFSEAMCKFWKKFVVEGDPLPDNNIKGYIFSMAKFYAINQQAQEKRNADRLEKKGNFDKEQTNEKTHLYFLEEQRRADDYQLALKKGIKKLGAKCREIFEYILKHGIDKPSKMYKALGYKNAGTMSSKKSECSKRLKLKVAVELDLLHQLKPNRHVHYN